MEITEKQENRIRQATEDFRKAMEVRNAMSIRVATRVTAILRIGMVSFGVVAILLLLMLFAFTSKMDEMIVALNTMNKQFTSMSQDMAMMRTTLVGMEQNISHVPVITQATKNIGATVGMMRVEVSNMEENIANLNYEVDVITNQVGSMSWQMRSLDPAVQHMGVDVNRMSGPMRMFNMFNPFD